MPARTKTTRRTHCRRRRFLSRSRRPVTPQRHATQTMSSRRCTVTHTQTDVQGRRLRGVRTTSKQQQQHNEAKTSSHQRYQCLQHGCPMSVAGAAAPKSSASGSMQRDDRTVRVRQRSQAVQRGRRSTFFGRRRIGPQERGGGLIASLSVRLSLLCVRPTNGMSLGCCHSMLFG